MADRILVGFEKGTGASVYMEHHHGVVSGQTQKSGKTTTIKALISRSKLKSVVFLTKRDEIGFEGFNKVQPYYREPKKGTLIDWQYVESVLQAVMGEKMKLERSFIINSCRGAHSLEEVYENIIQSRERARRGFDQSIFTNLAAYFEIVLPQIREYKFASSLHLEKGINVMDLRGLTGEMQALVIQSTLNYILDRMRGVIAVVPEAWKFVPKGGNPVKLAASSFVRQGAGGGNYLWVDSQDLTGVDTEILKQCNNWLMGFQRELNEAERVAKTAGKKVTTGMIQSLKLGFFVAVIGVENPRIVYVWPEGVPEKMARDVALGVIEPEVVKEYLASLAKRRGEDDDMVWKERYEEAQRKLEEAQAELKRLKEQPTASNEESGRMQQRIDALGEAVGSEMAARAKAEDQVKELKSQLKSVTEDAATMDGQLQQLGTDKRALEQRVRELKPVEGLLEAIKGIVAEAVPADKYALAATAHDIVLEVQEPTVTVEKKRYTINVTSENLEGRLLMLWINGDIGVNGGVIAHGDLRAALHKYNWITSNPNITAAMDRLVEWKIMDINMKGTVKRWVPRMSPSEAMTKGLLKVSEATEEVRA